MSTPTPTSIPTATPILSLNNIEVIYDKVALAIKGVSVEVPQGGMVALLGANGAGKSTTLKSISGLLQAERGEVTRGDIRFMGQDIAGLAPQARVKLGMWKVGGCSSPSRPMKTWWPPRRWWAARART